MELYLKSYKQEGILETLTILRLGNLYGFLGSPKKRHRGFFDGAISSAFRGEEVLCFGGGDFVRDFIHVDDVVSAFIGLIESDEKGPGDLIINRLRHDMVKRGDMLNTDDVIDILGVNLLGIVPDDESIIISTNQGRPIVMENGSLAGQAFRNIALRITGQDVPFVSLEDNSSFMKRISNFFKVSA